MKKNILLLFLIIIFSSSCNSPRHYHVGKKFIQNPTFDMYGASLEKINEDLFQIKGYFKSSITGRSEYIYENIKILIPRPIVHDIKKEIIPLPQFLIPIQFSKGGMGGQITTTSMDGTMRILEFSDDKIVIQLDVTFTQFKKEGTVKMVDSIHRKGLLSAKKGYKLY